MIKKNRWCMIVQFHEDSEWYNSRNHIKDRPFFSHIKNFPIKKKIRYNTYTELVNHMLKGLDV